ncbi:MAG TPA: TnsA-like heteromeric transposase endonuclease subunit [Kineosporiaceae bacterium]|nr:TnsA-like heteromeric transposase endonuclease subunit [Kineosporiaceae bacterium]
MTAVAVLAEAAADRAWVEYRSADGGALSGPWSSMWSTPFESASPWRGFASYRGQSSFSGWWWSATTRAHVGFESWLERDQLMVLDFDPGVLGIASQPFRLSWRDAAGVRRRHVPDYFARLADGSGLVVDVRADDRIGESDAAAFEVTRRACEQIGWRFRRVGAVGATLLANLRWLAGYRHPRHARPVDRQVAREVFGAGLPLVEGARQLGDPVRVLPGVYHWLWRGDLLVVDLETATLSLATTVTTASSAPGTAAVHRLVRWSQ